MPLLVTSAAGANGNGYGTLLAFELNGRPLGAFSDDSRIADPRGLAVDRDEGLLFLNSGTDRVLALDPNGNVVRDSGPIEGLNPGGGNFGPDGRYYVGLKGEKRNSHSLPFVVKNCHRGQNSWCNSLRKVSFFGRIGGLF